MKKQTVKILSAFFLLLSFAVGQVIIYGHSHIDKGLTNEYSAKHQKSKALDDTCKICHLHGHVDAFFQADDLTVWYYSSSYVRPIAKQAHYYSVKFFYAFDRGPPVA